MTPDIPPPPPGWAIVPAGDPRLDCLPVRPMFYSQESKGWYLSLKGAGDKAGKKRPYALPIEPASQPAEPKAETFLAHGKTWTRHEPGDPRPCDGEAMVEVAFQDGTHSPAHVATAWEWGVKNPGNEWIVGWRYAEQPSPPLATVVLANGATTTIHTAEQARGMTIDRVARWHRIPNAEERALITSVMAAWNPPAPSPPWSLPPPPAGQAWHREDWTAEMLPDGYRPLLLGEAIQDEDEWSNEPQKADTWRSVRTAGTVGLVMRAGIHLHHRTRRPLPSNTQKQDHTIKTVADITMEMHGWTTLPIPAASPDPKGEAGKAKAPLALLPPEAMRQAAWAHSLGAAKYGAWNWRENKVQASTYISAMLRHIAAYLDGKDNDAETSAHAGQPVSHLANVIASANILIDAKAHGTLIDDRPPARASRGPGVPD